MFPAIASLCRRSAVSVSKRASPARFLSTAAPAGGRLLEYEVQNRVGIITLNRPSVLNALTVAMGDELGELIATGIDTSKVGCIVITGKGKAFSAGGDLSFLRDRSRDSGLRNAAIMRGFYSRFLRIREIPVPTIAAINGPAIGAGLCFALAADLRIASKGARLGVTFVGLGLHPGMGATHFLPRLVGPQLAARLCLTGETISGEEAAKAGLVLEAVEGGPEAVLPVALALAGKIAAQGPVAVRSCVRSLRLQAEEGLDRALWREADAQSYCYSGPDLAAGIEAVASKTAPNFTQYEKYGV